MKLKNKDVDDNADDDDESDFTWEENLWREKHSLDKLLRETHWEWSKALSTRQLKFCWQIIQIWIQLNQLDLIQFYWNAMRVFKDSQKFIYLNLF